MSVIEMGAIESGFRSLHTVDDHAGGVYWAYMHKQSSATAESSRPCFSVQLLKELRQHQLRIADAMRRPVRDVDQPRFRHLVLASKADVFNLGGDLDLFCRLIRSQNRAALMAYARQCVDVAYGLYNHLNEDVHTIALVQGDALGGGFEAALACQTIVAEEGIGMGLPEVLFDLFPGMGAYSFLCRRVSPRQAEEMMTNGNIYSAQELHRMGIVDVLVQKGAGVSAVQDVIRRNQRITHARMAMNRVRDICHPVTIAELTQIVEVWVDTALQLGDKSLKTMERLVRAQDRRVQQVPKGEVDSDDVSNVARA